MIGEETARYIMGFLIGLPWPEGDPAACRAAATHWRATAAAVDRIVQDTQQARRVIAEAGDAGASIRAFETLTADLLPRVERMRIASAQMADDLDKYADLLEKAQHRFSYLAWRVAVDIGVTVVFGFLTAGLGSAVTAAYLARVFTAGAKTLAELSFLARSLVMASYYAVDSVAYAIVDVGALKIVDLVKGEPGSTWGDFGRTIGANAAFDATLDAQESIVRRFAGDAIAGTWWARAGMRLASSAFVYTPVENALAGKPMAEWPSSWEQIAQKSLIHVVGRPLVTDPYRRAVGLTFENWTRQLLGR